MKWTRHALRSCIMARRTSSRLLGFFPVANMGCNPSVPIPPQISTWRLLGKPASRDSTVELWAQSDPPGGPNPGLPCLIPQLHLGNRMSQISHQNRWIYTHGDVCIYIYICPSIHPSIHLSSSIYLSIFETSLSFPMSSITPIGLLESRGHCRPSPAWPIWCCPPSFPGLQPGDWLWGVSHS